MRTYYFKIRDKFIQNIRDGIKKHEYRLASPENRQIKSGDNLVLISNQDENKFVRVKVDNVVIYNSWTDALESNWQQDFKDLYDNLEDALHECYKFYNKDDVDRCGIISFEISPVYPEYFNTDVLLDTNIIIKRESYNNVSFEIAKLFNWFDKKNIKKYIHTLTKQELSAYGDEKIRDTILTKIESYEVLPAFRKNEDDLFKGVVASFSDNKNARIDNTLLNEIYNDNVGILVTDDNQMLKKAEMLYIRDRVLSSAEYLEKFETAFPQNIEYKMLAVKLKRFDEVELDNCFFNTLREDYGGQDFDRWFKRKGAEQAYVFEDSDGLKGFLYLKIEDKDEPDYLKVEPHLSPKRRLKVGTFKINRSGFRLGERFLKIIFDNARTFDVEEIYVTLFEDKRDDVRHLKKILEEWGFYKYGEKENGEAVLVKSMKIYDDSKDSKYNYPLHKRNPRFYLLPIYPEYHTDLFPDMILKNEDMHLYEENKAHRYALEKVYLSGASNVQGQPGDIVLIYRIGGRYPKKFSSVVTGIAIIEEIIETKSIDECISICKNRSIFDEQEIRNQYWHRKTVIKLLDHTPFKTKVILDKLQSLRIVAGNSGPRPFHEISKEQYDAIYSLGME